MLIPLTQENVRDLRLCGHVIYTGKSSMEVVVKMELLKEGATEETVLLGQYSLRRGAWVYLLNFILLSRTLLDGLSRCIHTESKDCSATHAINSGGADVI